jgi:hypothetical protein
MDATSEAGTGCTFGASDVIIMTSYQMCSALWTIHCCFYLFLSFILQSYTFIHHYLLTMHLGRSGVTKGPCFTIKDYMHRVRHVTYTITIITYL